MAFSFNLTWRYSYGKIARTCPGDANSIIGELRRYSRTYLRSDSHVAVRGTASVLNTRLHRELEFCAAGCYLGFSTASPRYPAFVARAWGRGEQP
jgi:hypothetical protein